MINSRKLEDLLPKVKGMAEKHIAICEEKKVDLLVTSTFRDFEAQAALYAIGEQSQGIS